MHLLFSVSLQNEQSGHLCSDVIAINAMVRTVAAAACGCVTVASPGGEVMFADSGAANAVACAD